MVKVALSSIIVRSNFAAFLQNKVENMFSKLFSKDNNTIIKVTTKAAKSEEGYTDYSNHYDLPNNKVLFITQDEVRNNTILKIFLNDDLTNSVVERILEGNYNLLCIFPDGAFLLEEHWNSNVLVTISHNTLITLSTQPWEPCYAAGVIDNNRFFIIKKDEDKNKLDYSLLIYKWKGNAYDVSNEIKLPFQPKTVGYVKSIQKIKNNRYCCHDIDEFRVLIVDIDVATNKLKKFGVIQPQAFYGNLVILPNGQLLTYCDIEDHAVPWDRVQVFDTETLKCVKEWYWADIQRPKGWDNQTRGVFSFYYGYLKIMPFPDSINLLVHKGTNIYLFNTEKLVMRPIELAAKIERFGKSHILPNGQIITFTERCDLNTKYVNIIHFALPEMRYREFLAESQQILTESQHLVRLFFKSKGFPTEITNHIFSYAFTPEVKENLARKLSNNNEKENNENQKCLVM